MSHLRLCGLLFSIVLISGCANHKAPLENWAKGGIESTPASPSVSTSSTAVGLNNDDYYEVHHDGRIYIFDDVDVYKGFLLTGEAAYRRARIGGGPGGHTLVFGLSDADKEKTSGIGSEDMWDGKIRGAKDNFYAEVLLHNRFYVFSTWADLVSFHQTWDAPYRLSDIGAGPRGYTVVYVLNQDNKEQKPLGLMARFRQVHGQ